jgi:predicted NBD/HSP70 family sugar kinase/biotin operon repressor
METEDRPFGSLRDFNRDRVIDSLRAMGIASRAEIARRTQLSRSTVSSIVADLQREGLVVQRDSNGRSTPAAGGRPPTLISLDRSAGLAVGIDFGKRHLTVAVADLSHTLLAEESREMPGDYGADEGMTVAAELADDVLGGAGVARDRVLGVGMGLPGPVHRTGTVGSSAILPGWAGVRPGEEMTKRLSLPVYVGNDANLGALAEFTWGAGRECASVAYLKLATGIGAGLIVRGRVLRGAGGTAGEIGHTTIDEAGDICRCGNRGCLETVAGAPAIVDLLQRSFGEELEPAQVVERARDGDAGCQRALADAGRHVGVAVANLCNLVNPERIVVGGTIGQAGAVVLEPLRESVRLRAIPSAAEDVEIVPGELGERAELLGAVALVLQEAGTGVPNRESASADGS